VLGDAGAITTNDAALAECWLSLHRNYGSEKILYNEFVQMDEIQTANVKITSFRRR
jgi:hypothetical protein